METIELHGLTFKIEREYDGDAGAPWENIELLGAVDDGARHKRPGERIINTGHGNWRRFYDFAGAVAAGRRAGMTGTRAAEAAEHECKWLADWCHDRWHYIGVVVTLLDADGNDTGYSESCWGIEDDGDHADVIAQDLALGLGASVNWDDVLEIPSRTVVLKRMAVAA
jgi:hypothetical protein